MARNLGFLLALAVALFSARAAALGLGEITLDSALNQRFSAEIELLETRGLDTNEIIVTLGSRQDFERVGVERFFFLTDLRFEVVRGRDGTPVLRVSSSQPITEPFLNFVVQVLWPNGKLLKEYTVLLDPPVFAEQTAPAVAAPARGDPGGGPAGRVQRRPPRPDSQVSFREPPSPTASPSPQDRISSDSYGMTDRDDTLWSIATRVKPSDSVTVQQTMLAIQRMNPEAFIGGNINLLKAGYRLRLPDEAQVASLTQSQAVAQVAEHNAAWQDYRQGRGLRPTGAVPQVAAAPDEQPSPYAAQVDATATTGAAPRAVEGPDGELRIVAGSTGNDGAGAGETGTSAELETQLAASEEERDRVALENEELNYRLDQMTQQVEQTQRQLEVRDQQIAQLQAQLAEIQEQLQAAAAAPPQAAAAPAARAEAPFWQSPYVLVGGTAVIVSLLAWGLVAARRRQTVEAGAGLFDEEAVDETTEPFVAAAASTADDEEAVAEEEDDFWDDEEAEEPAAEAEEEVAAQRERAEEETASGAQTSDVIGEADIYIAYGRYPQAVSLLLGALDDDPGRSEVRLKLLEVYTETKDQEGFDAHMAQLIEHCDDDQILLEARELEARLREEDSADEIASTATPAETVEGENATVDGGRGEAAPAAEDFDLSVDDAADDEPVSLSDIKASADDAGHGDELGGDLGIDFNPDADDTLVRKDETADATVELAADEAPELDDDFDLDGLELDTGDDSDLALETKTAAQQDESEDAFDFLDEEDAATTKLDLARAYIDMGDEDGAREILSEVLAEGSDDQQQQAGELLEKIS